MRVGILGANGQIASTLLRRLSEVSEVKPVAVCRNPVGAAVISDVDCEVRIGSVADENTAKSLLSDCHTVVNCIWPNLPSKEVRRENEAIIDNLAGLNDLKRLIHLSSIAVYGFIHTGSKFARPRPDTSYGEEKLSLERYVEDIFSNGSREYFVLRLGHVFGPHQWLSRSILQLAASGFELPFDGRCPSNAIHVAELANALSWLVSGNVSSGIYNLAATPQKTWRQMFDWHTEICSLPGVRAMSNEDSDRLRANYINGSQRSSAGKLLLETLTWLRSLPFQQLLGTGEVRNVGSGVLKVVPPVLRNRIKKTNALRQVTADIGALQPLQITPDPWFCYSAMPGRYLEVPNSVESANVDAETQMRDWHRAKSGPQWDRPGMTHVHARSNAVLEGVSP